MTRYRRWLQDRSGVNFANYEELRQWSVGDLDGFWQSIWDYFDLKSQSPHRAVLAQRKMPGAVWFPGARVNYARQVLRHVEPAHEAGQPAIVSSGEDGVLRETSWPELKRKVAALALHLKENGVRSGDRVAAYLPNIPETMIAFLATASLGAIWSLCAPDMAAPAVIDRFERIEEPKVLIACESVIYAGRRHDRRPVIDELRRALPTVEHLVLHGDAAGADRLETILAGSSAAIDAFEPEWLSFDHPLWIVYSSGTTGLPKPIVHGHGGVMIVGLPLNVLHNDIGCSYEPMSLSERYHWYSSTGWIMWNCQVSGLLNGTTCCIFDGSPGGSKDNPDWLTLWRFVASARATFFGAGAAFFASCTKAEIDLAASGDLSRLRALRLDRLAALRRHAKLVQRSLRQACGRQRQQRAGGHVVGQHVRRHGFRRRFHRRQPRAAASSRHHAVPPARLRGGNPSTRQAVRWWNIRREHLHRAAAVDAAALLERPGRRTLPFQLFRDLSRQFRWQRPRRGVAPW